MEFTAYGLAALVVLAALFQVRTLIGILVYLSAIHLGWGKRLFIPLKSTKAMSATLETLVNLVSTGVAKFELRKRILVIEQEGCETVYVLVDKRSAFYGCCVNRTCSALVFQELPDHKSLKKLSKMLDEVFGQQKQAESNTPKRF